MECKGNCEGCPALRVVGRSAGCDLGYVIIPVMMVGQATPTRWAKVSDQPVAEYVQEPQRRFRLEYFTPDLVSCTLGQYANFLRKHTPEKRKTDYIRRYGVHEICHRTFSGKTALRLRNDAGDIKYFISKEF